MSTFTPWPALAGGALIGAAAVLLLWANGRVAGISGIAGGLWFAPAGERAWRWAFLFGLALGAAAWALLGPALSLPLPLPLPLPRQGFPLSLLLLAGLLAGYGTSLGGGCTSGHGVCGLARLAPRSLAATAVFMASAAATTYVVRHLLGLA
jgi:uncharacterized membrane protein YedE/YeeE